MKITVHDGIVDGAEILRRPRLRDGPEAMPVVDWRPRLRVARRECVHITDLGSADVIERLGLAHRAE